MNCNSRLLRRCGSLAAATISSFALMASSETLGQPRIDVNPMIKQDAAVQLSEHAYVILDENVSFVPNVGIVVGDRATLVIDTGLGEANGRIVLEEARKLSANQEFYIAATHYHPEHDLGATAFPANAKMVRWVDQQTDVDEIGEATNQRFAGFSPVLAGLLDGARFREPDILFEDAITIDLGGVRVSVWGVGPNHTRGDSVFFVEGEGVLYTGDVVMSVFPSVSAQSADLEKWIANMNAFEDLDPEFVVPAHGRVGDAGFIRRYREYLSTVKSHVAELHRQGATEDAVIETLADELAETFSDLRPAGGPGARGRITNAIRAAYREAGSQ